MLNNDSQVVKPTAMHILQEKLERTATQRADYQKNNTSGTSEGPKGNFYTCHIVPKSAVFTVTLDRVVHINSKLYILVPAP